MSLIRAEARKLLWRTREILVGIALACLGLFWAVMSFGVLSWVGFFLLAAGFGLIGMGLQRARFRVVADGPGVVQVDEGQITYFGPLSGGTVATADLERLILDNTSQPAHWVLDQRGQPPVYVPLNAAGSDALFDAFATLPGLRTQRMLNLLRRAEPHAVVIWERAPLRPVSTRLH